ncbi:MAG: sigma-54-dependent Fis family transcriptional regulator [Cyclobacteriaceae bacterium]|nr:sigma-54-dependent Fis family transcriptional regulator [Cyclobacteriaceae bacterium HetDA_MAG_MS6]
MKKGHILVVDDDDDVLVTARMILKRDYHRVSTEPTPNRLESILRQEEVDLVILDMNFKAGVTSGNEGLFWLGKLKELAPDIQVLMNTAYGDIDLAVECMKQGAADFLVKPWETEKLRATVRNVFELGQSKKRVKQLEETTHALTKNIEASYSDLIYSSDQMKGVVDAVQKVAGTEASVLILGENGTGKEVIARMIHRLSDRRDKSLIKVDLGALSGSLLESELFGHVKGAFTDAREDRSGRFEIAHGGTLFLDEIGNLPVEKQVKLLTVLQSGEVSRVGGNRLIPVDVRLISATNEPVHHLADRGKFRQDLLYRINTVEIYLPPLRERKEDIAVLADHFLDLYKNKYQKVGLTIETSALRSLTNYAWPGNVRELQHAMERAVIMTTNPRLRSEDFLLSRKEKQMPTQASLKVTDIEKSAIITAIEESAGNISQAAAKLGMGRTTLYRKMKRYRID